MNKEILRLAIPNIIANISVPLLGLVDTWMMGHLSSPSYLGAVALGSVIFNFIYWGFGFLRMGTSGFTAQAYGKRNLAECTNILFRSLLFSIAFAILILCLQTPVKMLSFGIMKGSPEVESLAQSYFNIRIWTAPATLGLYAFMGWFIGMQNSLYPMVISIILHVINISANLLFVQVLGMHSDGIALGSLVAQYSGVLTAIILFYRRYGRLLKYREWKQILDIQSILGFFHVNKDIFIRTLCVIFTLSFFTSKSAEISDEILAANNILLQFMLLFSFFIDGFSYAGEALVGKYIGMKKKNEVIKVVKHLLFWGMGLSIPFCLLYAFAGKQIMMLLTDKLEIIEAANPYFIWATLIPLATFAAFTWDGIYIGATSSVAMRNTMLFATFAIFLPTFFICKQFWNVNHCLWLALSLYMVTRGIWLTLLRSKYIYSKCPG